MRYRATLVLFGAVWLAAAHGGNAVDPPAARPAAAEVIKYIDSIRPKLVSVNQDVWTFAELGLQEHRSAGRLTGVLRKAGFRVKEGVSGMPTAFVPAASTTSSPTAAVSRTSCRRRPRSGTTCGPTLTPTSNRISTG